MALEKQKILNELGSVANQLQSANCGCMEKLFSNPNQPNSGNYQIAPMISPMHDGGMRSCCHGHECHRYNALSAGETFTGNRSSMDHCNAAKLCGDTYNYFNNNLMQPVVKEVYDDLKSISPTNTIMNDPMGAQMGLRPGNAPNPAAQGGMPGQTGLSQGNPNLLPQSGMPGQMGSMAQNQIPGEANVHSGNTNMGNMQMGNPNTQQQMRQMAQPMPPMSGMGESKRSNPNQGGTQENAPQSPDVGQYDGGINNPGQYTGGMPDNNPGPFNNGTPSTGQYNNLGMNNIRQSNPSAPMQNPNVQNMSQPNTFPGANTNMQGNLMDGKMSQMNPGSQPIQSMSPVQPQMNAPNASYSQLGAGMPKFKELIQRLKQGEDLGFDPMAIAMQMKQQRAAMDTMQKLMMSNGKGLNANASLLQPVINATSTAMANIAQPPTNQITGQQNVVPTTQQQQISGANASAVPFPHNQVPTQQLATQQQQYQRQRQQMIDLNTGAVVGGTLQTVYEGSENPNVVQDVSPPTRSPPLTTQQMIKEPIFPVDSSKNLPPAHMNQFRQQMYNTLGQPVDLIPADIYRTPEPNLPQTLSPQSVPRSDLGKYSNVKATVSKTSSMGIKSIDRTPNKGQLQQIYNQYKGSQSYTQQNIRTLNVNQVNTMPQAAVEKVGGDTIANTTMNNAAAGHKPNQIGDVAAANDARKAPVINSKVRNGLQDMKFTSYPTSAAWSFRGPTPAPYATPCRFR